LATESTTNKYEPGVVIAEKYRLLRLLGEGGMGAVWLAHNVTLDSEVAIKLIRNEAAPEAKARLLQEARAAARLSHPSIVRVFDFGQTALGDPFIVMEHLSGGSLAQLIDQAGRIPATEAVALILPVAKALLLAHEKSVVHRDLKPDNVLLVHEDGGGMRPKIVDFGLAKSPDDGIDRALTIAGTVLGSPDYMSPEQARGRSDISWPSDLWSFTIIVYEMITGRRPFDGPNYNALLSAIILDEPVPTTQLGAGDAALWGILERGLQKDPGRRWASTREMVTALIEWALSRGVNEDCTGAKLSLDGPLSMEVLRTSLIEISWLAPISASSPPPVSAPIVPSSLTTLVSGEASNPEIEPESLSAHETLPPEPPEPQKPRLALLAAVVAAVAALVLVTNGVWLATRSSPAVSAESPSARPPGGPSVPVGVATAGVSSLRVEPAEPATSAAPPASSTSPTLPPSPARAKPPSTQPRPASSTSAPAPAARKVIPLIPTDPNY
jgi:serine/threonine-protein kinase